MAITEDLSVAQAGVTGERAELDKLYRKITLRLLPFLMGLWVLAWLDRVNVGFAKLQMLESLKFSEAVYGLGAGIFFLGYFLFEVPSNALLQRIGAKKTIMRIAIGWGTICVLQAWVSTPLQFYVLRFLLGAFEAGFYPGVILYLTQWYPTQRRARAFGTFMSASALAGVLGGPLAGIVMTNMDTVNGMHGWQWLFIIEGIPSVLAGIMAYFWMTDAPDQAKWLSDHEKRMVRETLAADSQSLGHRAGDWRSVFGSPKVWLLIAIFFCLLCANSALTFWLPTILRDAGFETTMQIGWIAAGAYLCGAAGMVLLGANSDRNKEIRWHFAIPVTIAAVSIAMLGLLLGQTSVNQVMVVAMLVLAVVGTMSAIPIFWQLPNLYLAGAAAAIGVAFINSVANLAGFGAPFALGAIKESTGSLSPGLFAVAGIEFGAALLVILCISAMKLRKQ